ncbi:MAG: hypothetical protein HGA49_13035, partial [Eubacteriaceae bacterium]|nr:hypothetical protein [Eubacteriaceae bacterium]
LNGSSTSNIVNRNLTKKGVQIEMTKALRDSFYTSTGSASLTLSKYSAALNKAIKTYYVSKGIVQ